MVLAQFSCGCRGSQLHSTEKVVEISPQEKPHGIFGHSSGVNCMTPVIRTVTSRGPPRKMRHLPWSVHLRRRNPRQRPLVSWPSRGEKPMGIACLDAYLPCFGWSLGLVFGGLTYPSKTEAPLRFQVGDGLRCFFWIWQAETWGSELAWNYLEPALSGFWRGRKKGSFQQRAWRGSELRNCSGVRIWAWSSSTSFVLKPHFYVSRGKNALFFCLVSVVFLNNSGCRCLREMPPSQEIRPYKRFINHHDPWRIP